MTRYLNIVIAFLVNHAFSSNALRLVRSSNHAGDLQAVVEETWNQIPENRIDVLASSFGHWAPKAEPNCKTPKLWIYLYGLYRTFHYTQMHYKEMASKSSSDCFMFVAVMPLEICESGGGTSCKKPRWIEARQMDWSPFAKNINDTPLLLSRAQTETFDGQLAYAVINRTGSYTKYPNFLSPYWDIPHRLAKMSASANGFETSPSSMVIRGRPDLLFLTHFDISGALSYFASGHRGRHLVFANNMDKPAAQSDVLIMTSVGAYETDFANAISSESNMKREIGMKNGWGFGYDVETSCVDDSCPSVAVQSFRYANKDIDRFSFEEQAEIGFDIAVPISHVDDIVRFSKKPHRKRGHQYPAGPLDLTASVHLYCKHAPSKKQENWELLTMFTHVYRSREGYPLFENGKPVEAPWPEGC